LLFLFLHSQVNEELSVAELQALLAAAKKEIALLKKQIALLKANPNAKISDLEGMADPTVNKTTSEDTLLMPNGEAAVPASTSVDFADSFISDIATPVSASASRLSTPALAALDTESVFTEADDERKLLRTDTADINGRRDSAEDGIAANSWVRFLSALISGVIKCCVSFRKRN
jgi:hypothetical protein